MEKDGTWRESRGNPRTWGHAIYVDLPDAPPASATQEVDLTLYPYRVKTDRAGTRRDVIGAGRDVSEHGLDLIEVRVWNNDLKSTRNLIT